MSTPRLVLLPGLGADARMFEGQRAVVADFEVPEWIEPLNREPLAAYARRMASTIEPTEPGRRLFLGGSSFGGMVALEMARHVDAAGVILIGSCVHPHELSRLIQWCAGFQGHMPKPCSGVFRLLMPCSFTKMKPGGVEQRKLLAEMSRGVSMPFIRWGANTMVKWAGAEDLDVPVHRVHGSHDRIIPPTGLRLDRMIEGAGHVPSMSHPEEVNRFLASVLEPARTSNES
jgi:pimeloyl-ACP methyl ester carboxylesterase